MIFISYRRADSDYISGRLFDELADHFGSTNVFKDTESIGGAQEFRRRIEESLGESSIVVAVIGSSWLNILDADGNRRLNDSNDYVRWELETALSRGLPVLPVLVNRAEMPRESELPTTLAAVCAHHARPLRPDPDFHPDAKLIIQDIEAYIPKIAPAEGEFTSSLAPDTTSDVTSRSPIKSWHVINASLLFGALLVPPLFIVTAFLPQASKNVMATIILLAMYEGLVVAAAFFSKVWSRLEAPWTERLAYWIMMHTDSWLSRYKRKYKQYLTYQHRDLDTRGLPAQGIFTLSLGRVFVNLSLAPVTIPEASPDPIGRKIRLNFRDRPIWHYLGEQTLKSQHFVVLGPPGSGKTTLLKHVLLTLVESTSRLHEARGMTHRFPILLYLRECARQLQNSPSSTLATVLHEQLQTMSPGMVPLTWIERRLSHGRCLILLDGLDEVADPAMRRITVDWVQRQMIVYGANRFVLTSRPGGYRANPLAGVAILEVEPFGIDKINRFLQNWFIADAIMSAQRNDAGVRTKAATDALDLLTRLRNFPALLSLATNPLLLTMIATLHRYRPSPLPRRRVDLYKDACEVFLGRRQATKGLRQPLTVEQNLFVLQHLANYMMNAARKDIGRAELYAVIEEPISRVRRDMRPDEFLEWIEESSGLILEKERDHFTFAHLTFQEYLAARFIATTSQSQSLVEKVSEEWWHETVRLYCAQADATPIILACAESFADLENSAEVDEPSGSLPALSTLSYSDFELATRLHTHSSRAPESDYLSAKLLKLALECRDEALELQPSIAEKLDKLVDQSVDSRNLHARVVVAEAFLDRRFG